MRDEQTKIRDTNAIREMQKKKKRKSKAKKPAVR
jgi:hypothetical protein